jgi:hypothetical protein
MCTLTHLLTYIIDTYSSEKYPVSPPRLINILYLTDWKAAISMHKTISGIQWKIIDSEPKVDDSTLKEIIDSVDRKGRKLGFGLIGKLQRLSTYAPSKIERPSIDFVTDFAKNQSDEALSLMVKSTYPTITQDESDIVNLADLAEKYGRVKSLLT